MPISDPGTPENDRSSHDESHRPRGDECDCSDCCEPTEAQIERMLDAPDAAERRAEMTRIYFDLK